MRTIAAAAIILASGAAHAADLPGATYDGKYQRGTIAAAEIPHSWTGVYGGAAIGYGMAKHDLALSAIEKGESGDVVTPIAGLEGIGAEGAIGKVHAGADWQIGRVVARVRGDYAWSEVESTLRIGSSEATATKGDEWAVWAGAGISVTPTTLVYGMFGRVEGETKLKAGGQSLTLDDTGYAGAVGMEHVLAGASNDAVKTTLVLEAQYIDYDRKRFEFEGGRLDVDSGELRILGGINLRLGLGQ